MVIVNPQRREEPDLVGAGACTGTYGLGSMRLWRWNCPYDLDVDARWDTWPESGS